MKQIFVGSSTGALKQTKVVAGLLSQLPNVNVRPWYDDFVFPPGLLTYEVIEEEARCAAGAVFLATPDNPSVIRGKKVMAPRANVMLELGHFSAVLGRKAIALCLYDRGRTADRLERVYPYRNGI